MGCMEMNSKQLRATITKHKLHIFTTLIRTEALWGRSPARIHRRWVWVCTCGDWSGHDRPAGYHTWKRVAHFARAHYLRNHHA